MRRSTLLLHGSFERLSSFSLINRRLAGALDSLGWRVHTLASDASAVRAPSLDPPDVYVFHGHPYDITNAPGRVNVFVLSYDYARFVSADRYLAARLDTWFDALIVPSRFARSACRRSGVSVPIHVCPWGIDPDEFHPDAPPVAVPDRRRFCFVALGGATERKGTDVLLTAFAREFTGADDVTLLVKAFAYRHLVPWAEALIDKARRRSAAPHIVWDYSEPSSVAGYFTAADMGVFPFRGEGFGLPILECLASGTPAIVTRSGGPLDYGRVGATWLDARPVTARGDKAQLEPDVAMLRRLLRDAARRGPASRAERRDISRSASTFTWERTVAMFDRVLRETTPRAGASRVVPVAYFHFEDGRTSWRQSSGHVKRALIGRDPRTAVVPFSARIRPPRAAVIVAQSGVALEPFRRAGRVTTARVIHRESGPLETMAAIIAREREACGVAPAGVSPMALWRDRIELQLADRIVVTSRLSQRLFVEAGYAADRMRVLPPGISPRPLRPRRTRGVMKFLFVASDPFRKGIRVLLEAWSRVRGRAELCCVVPNEMLSSPLVLRHLTRDPRVVVAPFVVGRSWPRWFDEFDVLVLPSFEEGFPAMIGKGMARGVPAIVSTTAGITDIITSGENGFVHESGDAAGLSAAIDALAGSPAEVRRLGVAARDTARAYTWARYQHGWRAIVDEMAR